MQIRNSALIGAAIATFIVATPVQAAKDAAVLLPSSPWRLDTSEDHCIAMRNFGEGRDGSTLIMTNHDPRDSVWITMIGRPFETRIIDKIGQYNYHLLPSSTIGEFSANAMRAADGRVGIMSAYPISFAGTTLKEYRALMSAGNEPAQDQWDERLADVDSLMFTGPFRAKAVRLETGPLAGLLKAFARCQDAMVSSWGLSPEQQRTISQPEILKETFEQVSERVSGYYPLAALSRSQSARVTARVMIDEQGTPTDCTIVGITESENFGSWICDSIIEYARYRPAHDTDGNPEASYSMLEINYFT